MKGGRRGNLCIFFKAGGFVKGWSATEPHNVGRIGSNRVFGRSVSRKAEDFEMAGIFIDSRDQNFM